VLKESDERYDIYLHIFEELLHSQSLKIINFLVPLLFEGPFSVS